MPRGIAISNQLANFALLSYEKVINRQKKNMGNEIKLRRLQTASLADALKGMSVGESCLPPEGYSKHGVAKVCSELRHEGYIFISTCRTGDAQQQVVTRLK